MKFIVSVNEKLKQVVPPLTKIKGCVAATAQLQDTLLKRPNDYPHIHETVILSTGEGALEYKERKLQEIGVLFGIPVINTTGLSDVEVAWAIRSAKRADVPFKDVTKTYLTERFQKNEFRDGDFMYICLEEPPTHQLLDIAFRNSIKHTYIAVNDNGIAYASYSNGVQLPFSVVVCERDVRTSYNNAYDGVNSLCYRGPYVKFNWSDGTEINEALVDSISTTSSHEIKKLVLRYYFSIKRFCVNDDLTDDVCFNLTEGRDGELSISTCGDMGTLALTPFDDMCQLDYHVGMREILSLTEPINEQIYKECTWLGREFKVLRQSRFGFDVFDEVSVTDPERYMICTNEVDLDGIWGMGCIPVVTPSIEGIAAKRAINKSKITVIHQDGDDKITSVLTDVSARDFVFRHGCSYEIGDGFIIVKD
jgi:hypothetical protein